VITPLETLKTLLREHPRLSGIVYDRPEAEAAARANLASLGMAERADFVAGDFLRWAPPSDGYLMKHVLHDWADPDVVTILRCIREASLDGARLLIVEGVLPPPPAAPGHGRLAHMCDLHQATFGGRERSEDGWRRLIGEGGFSLHTITHTFIEDVSILECIPI
jgi:hypothetical protein